MVFSLLIAKIHFRTSHKKTSSNDLKVLFFTLKTILSYCTYYTIIVYRIHLMLVNVSTDQTGSAAVKIHKRGCQGETTYRTAVHSF